MVTPLEVDVADELPHDAETFESQDAYALNSSTFWNAPERVPFLNFVPIDGLWTFHVVSRTNGG